MKHKKVCISTDVYVRCLCLITQEDMRACIEIHIFFCVAWKMCVLSLSVHVYIYLCLSLCLSLSDLPLTYKDDMYLYVCQCICTPDMKHTHVERKSTKYTLYEIRCVHPLYMCIYREGVYIEREEHKCTCTLNMKYSVFSLSIYVYI